MAHTPRRFRKTTDSRHTKRIAPNLLERNFTVPAPNHVLAGDITYIATSDGCLYPFSMSESALATAERRVLPH
jgi:transposase InsO family protein